MTGRPPRLPLLAALLLAACARGAAPPPTGAPDRLVIHSFDGGTFTNALGGGMGAWALDAADTEHVVRFDLVDAGAGGSGQALRLSYAWDPAGETVNGLWMRLNGLDASSYDRLELRVRGDPEAGFGPAFQVQLKKPDPRGTGQTHRGSFVVEGVTSEWRTVSIPLNLLTGLPDRTGLEELVIVLHARRGGPDRGAYLIDDVALVRSGHAGPSTADPIPVPRKRAWERAHGAEGAADPAALRARLVGWPSFALADTAALPADDRAFLLRVARDTWRGIDALTDAEHGLPLDTVRFAPGSVRLEESRIGDYTNVTNVGLYLLCVVAARELGFLTRDEALARLDRTIGTLEGLERWRGFFFNYYDTTSGERTSHFVSFVDSAWLTAGLMAVRDAFPEVAARADSIVESQDYGLFYDPVERQMNHGWWSNLGVRAEYTYGVLYTEARAGSFIAVGKGDVPEEHWFALARTFPAAWDWQRLPSTGRRAKETRGHRHFGGWYEWKGLRYVPSWGGSLFEALMPTVVIDEARIAPRSLGANDVAHAVGHRRYALEEAGYPVWGMSPSSTPHEDSYQEYGVPVLGSFGYETGAVTPHVVALALSFTPREATKCLRELARRYPIYGDFGFYDAVDPATGAVSYKYLALDQEMLLLGLANFLEPDCVRRHFMAHPYARRAAEVVAAEDFFE